jgi:YHYH protein
VKITIFIKGSAYQCLNLAFMSLCLAGPMLAHELAHDPAKDKRPLGDGKVSAEPKRGYVFACNTRFPGGGGAHRVGDWVKDGFWWPAMKPVVQGDVAWPNASITVEVQDNQRVVMANNLPLHTTGTYPIDAKSNAHNYDRNPNSIREQAVLLRLPATPEIAAQPGCVPMGMIGFALSGAAIFNAFDLAGRDAPAYEIQDKCNGHPERNGQYHYHDWSSCMKEAGAMAGGHSAVVGYMLDGFAIYGLKGEGGAELTNADLDECHGHAHDIELEGKKAKAYHYHFTREYPYTIGCFKGAVESRYLAAPRSDPPPRPR